MRDEQNDPKLSIIVPMYNEESCLDAFFERIEGVLRKLACSYEIICINDGSTDNTLLRLLDHHERNPCIKILDLSRNFGKDAALTAGLDYCCGEAVIPMDADLEDPPELIFELIEKWEEGFDVVYASRSGRPQDSLAKRMSAELFYSLHNSLSQIKIPHNTGDFRIMDKSVVQAIRLLREHNRFMKGVFSWVGFDQASVQYTRPKRSSGTTKWNYWKLWNFALDGITGFSTAPLRIWTYVGLLVAVFAILYAAIIVVRVLLLGVDVPGYASIIVVMLMLGAIQLTSLGIIGEYLGRLYEESKRRPIYLIKRHYGL